MHKTKIKSFQTCSTYIKIMSREKRMRGTAFEIVLPGWFDTLGGLERDYDSRKY